MSDRAATVQVFTPNARSPGAAPATRSSGRTAAAQRPVRHRADPTALRFAAALLPPHRCAAQKQREARVIVYPGVGRGFEFRPREVRTLADDLAARDSLARASAFIRRHLGTPAAR